MTTLSATDRLYASAALCVVALVWAVNGVYLAALSKIGLSFFWLADLAQWIVLPAVLLLLLREKCQIQPKDYGFDIHALSMRTSILAAGAFVTIDVAFLLPRNVTWAALGEPTGYFSFSEVYPSGFLGTLVWLYSAVTAGFVESIFFIGLPWLLYRSTTENPSRAVFIAAVSIVFAFVHWEQGPHTVVGAFFSHIAACSWFLVLGQMWPTAIGHTIVDLVAA